MMMVRKRKREAAARGDAVGVGVQGQAAPELGAEQRAEVGGHAFSQVCRAGATRGRRVLMYILMRHAQDACQRLEGGL
jgi:hypothetical protein